MSVVLYLQATLTKLCEYGIDITCNSGKDAINTGGSAFVYGMGPLGQGNRCSGHKGAKSESKHSSDLAKGKHHV